MFKRKRNAFTLIELIAVLVIMATIALIVTPLVMSIIRKARISADKRSVDAYGRSIELAIAGYLLDTGKFPTEISQLTIEYSGNEVVCTTTQINTDSSVYLAGCTVAGRSTGDYTYGELKIVTYDTYSVGDEVTYNGVDYYVIADSGSNESTVTLLKKTPLTTAELNRFGINHLNMTEYVTNPNLNSSYDVNGYGGMAYYSSDDCPIYTGDLYGPTVCKNDYPSSEIKYAIDAWKNEKAPLASEARILSKEEYILNCTEEQYQSTPSNMDIRYIPQYNWLYDSNYWYWTMSSNGDSTDTLWAINVDGNLINKNVASDRNGVVRPVITLSKSLIST